MLNSVLRSPEVEAAGSGGLSQATQSKIQLPADLSFNSVMSGKLVIPTENGGAWQDTVRTEDRAAAIELLVDIARKAPAGNVNMRWAGGCKGLSPEQVEGLFEFIAKSSVLPDGRCFRGAVGSGGTMEMKNGVESAMVCQIPTYLSRLVPSLAWGSTPATFRTTLEETSGVPIISKYGARFDHRGHLNILTQNELGAPQQGWDGDVRLYIEALQVCQKNGFKVAVGVVNGGDVTKDEALLALSKGIPVIIVDGSGRAADELSKAVSDGTLTKFYRDAYRRGLIDPDKDKIPSKEQIFNLVHIVKLGDVERMQGVMDKLGLIS